jgi:hypothetical protein
VSLLRCVFITLSSAEVNLPASKLRPAVILPLVVKCHFKVTIQALELTPSIYTPSNWWYSPEVLTGIWLEKLGSIIDEILKIVYCKT